MGIAKVVAVAISIRSDGCLERFERSRVKEFRSLETAHWQRRKACYNGTRSGTGWPAKTESNSILKMARKRIKTLANEWGVPVEDVLASCTSLRLPHSAFRIEPALAGRDRSIKADLDDQAQRTVLMRRETVLETSAGKVLEKRLNATVMRRRHAEPDAELRAVDRRAVPFRSRKDQDQSFAAPFFDEPLTSELARACRPSNRLNFRDCTICGTSRAG